MPNFEKLERAVEIAMYRIAGKGITVAFLTDYIDDPAWPIERICNVYGLTPAEVQTAWAFYYDHQAEIDEYLQEAAAYYEALPTLREHFERKRNEF